MCKHEIRQKEVHQSRNIIPDHELHNPEARLKPENINTITSAWSIENSENQNTKGYPTHSFSAISPSIPG
jgi:hypothetical protein